MAGFEEYYKRVQDDIARELNCWQTNNDTLQQTKDYEERIRQSLEQFEKELKNDDKQFLQTIT